MYTSKAIIESYLGAGINLNTCLDTFIKLAIQSATNFIETYCGEERFGKRIFEKPSTDDDQTRYFDGNGIQLLPIGDLKTLTSVTIDDVLQVLDEDYYLKPYNAVLEGKPYTHIDLIQPNGRNSSRQPTEYEFEKEQRNIAVIGKFRYSDIVPAEIKLVATKLASQILKEQIADQELKDVKAETFDDYKVEFVDVAKVANDMGVTTVLDQLKRKVITPKLGITQI